MKSSQKDDAENNQSSLFISLSADQLSDEVLLSAVARGAVWAMDMLYERYSRILYSLAYRMVADHQVAEDLLQDAFLAVWRRATSYSPQSGAARSWIVSIMHHRTIDYLRALRLRGRSERSPGKKSSKMSEPHSLMSGMKRGCLC